MDALPQHETTLEVEIEQKIVGCRPAAYHSLDFVRVRWSANDGSESEPSLAFSNDRVVYTADSSGIQHTLIGHEGYVNCIQCQRVDFPESLYGTGTIVSGDTAGTVCIWNPPDLLFRFRLQETFPNTSLSKDTSPASIICVAAPPARAIEHPMNAGLPVFCGTSAGSLIAIGSSTQVAIAQLGALPESVTCTGLDRIGNGLEEVESKLYLIFVGNAAGTIESFLFDDQKATLKRTSVLEGHMDSVRDLALCHIRTFLNTTKNSGSPRKEAERLMLASASHDTTVRLWIVASRVSNEPWNVLEEPDCTGILTEHHAGVSSARFISRTPSVLSGAQLLTAAFDRTVKIWNLETENETELRIERVAEMSIMGEQGLFQGFFSVAHGEWPDGSRVVFASTYSGALFQWRKAADEHLWRSEAPIFTGHHRGITDLDWHGPNSLLLITVSRDMTCRLFVCNSEGCQSKWTEIGRPQVHGHEIFASKFVDMSGLKLVTASEEKSIRMFTAPQNFLDLMIRVCGTSWEEPGTKRIERVRGASRMALSLTNQPIFEPPIENKSGYESSMELNEASDRIQHDSDRHLPLLTEAALQQDTLWPESEQLFAHPNNMCCLAAFALESGLFLLASACIAQSRQEATIRVWEVRESAEEVCLLAGHDLTITDMRFSCVQCESSNRLFLLSASRDRSWIVWDVMLQEMVARKTNAHTRMVLACAWFDPQRGLVLTGGRDKCVHLWMISAFPKRSLRNEHEVLRTWRFDSAVTAMDVTRLENGRVILIIGLETGVLHALQVGFEPPFESADIPFPTQARHVRTVTRIRFRPGSSNIFASSSEDSSVLIARLQCTRASTVSVLT
jgi:WD40 repeat protein